MATGDTAPPLALSSSPPPLLDNSPSNLSSPLSDVEDKDGEPEEMDLDDHMHGIDNPGTPKRNGNGNAGESDRDSESDDESKLSDVDVNDSEAETERLYDSPRKSDSDRDILNTVGSVGNRQFVDRRDRAFERSPSKLQQQIQADLDAENAASHDNSLSDGEEEDDDDASLASSEADPDPELATDKDSPSRSQGKKSHTVISSTNSNDSKLTRQDSAESRKRKRPSIAEQSETEQPDRKRTGSIEAPQGEFSGDDFAVVDEEGTSTNPQSGIHSAEEDHNDEESETINKEDPNPVELAEQDASEPVRLEKGRRGSKKQKSRSPQESSGETKKDIQDDAMEDVDSAAAEEPAHRAEGDHTEDADEAEIAHRNEEECKKRQPFPRCPLHFSNRTFAVERKKAAWEELNLIEKQFNNFRER